MLSDAAVLAAPCSGALYYLAYQPFLSQGLMSSAHMLHVKLQTCGTLPARNLDQMRTMWALYILSMPSCMQYCRNSHKLCADITQVPYGNSFHSHLQWDCVSVGERESRVRASCEVRTAPPSALSSDVGIGK